MDADLKMKVKMSKPVLESLCVEGERIDCHVDTTKKQTLIDLKERGFDRDASSAPSLVADFYEYSKPLKKLKLPLMKDGTKKNEELFIERKSLVSLAFASDANFCLDKLSSNSERKGRRHLQIAAVLEEASAVGLAVGELVWSSTKGDVYDDEQKIPKNDGAEQKIDPRRHRPQRRNSFVIHRDIVSSRCPLPPLALANSSDQVALPLFAHEVSIVSETTTLPPEGNQFPVSLQDSIACNSTCRSQQLTHQAVLVSSSNQGYDESEDKRTCNQKSSSVDLLENSIDSKSSVVSTLNFVAHPERISTPVLTKETKEYYGYE